MRHSIRSSVRRAVLPISLLLIALTTGLRAHAAPAAAAPRESAPYSVTGGRVPVPDSYVLATVGDRKITVRLFRERWYASDATLRPMPDSLGRIQFLHDLVAKEVLGQTALSLGREMDFEDRAAYRNYRNQVLSNMLFMRAVSAPGAISEDSLKKVHAYSGRELKLRLLYFATRGQAELTRQQLMTGRMTWAAALAKHAVRSNNVHDGVSEWLTFDKLPLEVALQVWPLRLGELSPLILASSGYHIVQILDERHKEPLPYNAVRRFLKLNMEELGATRRRVAIQNEAKQGMDVVYDSASVSMAATHFREALHINNEDLGGRFEFDANVPEFTPQDTARTVVKWKSGRLSVGDIVHEYQDTQPLLRPSINTPERFIAFVDAIMLGPRMTEIAEQRGLDKDSLAVVWLQRKQEEIAVTHMVEDSVLATISVTRDERRAFYKAHPQDFLTYPSVRYGVLVRSTKAGVDSLKAQLDHGTSIDTLIARDQRAGHPGAGTNTLASNDQNDMHKLLFEELRPGKSSVIGPDKQKMFAVVYEIAYDPGQPVPFESIESAIDESVRNIKGDQGVQALIGRLSKRYKIEAHPEVVMRIALLDPADEED